MNDWAIPNAAPMVTREIHPPCRCGWVDSTPLGVPPMRAPVRDLTDADGYRALETSPVRRACAVCTHPIQPGQACVVHRLNFGAAVFNRYHPECVEIR